MRTFFSGLFAVTAAIVLLAAACKKKEEIILNCNTGAGYQIQNGMCACPPGKLEYQGACIPPYWLYTSVACLDSLYFFYNPDDSFERSYFHSLAEGYGLGHRQFDVFFSPQRLPMAGGDSLVLRAVVGHCNGSLHSYKFAGRFNATGDSIRGSFYLGPDTVATVGTGVLVRR